MCSASVRVHTLHKCEQIHRTKTNLIAFPDTLILETMPRFMAHPSYSPVQMKKAFSTAELNVS